MKITESQLRTIIKQELSNILEGLHPLVKGMQVRKVGTEIEPASEDGPFDDVKNTTYNIVDKDGNVVGSLDSENYFGTLYGKLFGKDLPELTGYGGVHHSSGPLGKFHKFAKSKTGSKWLDKNKPE